MARGRHRKLDRPVGLKVYVPESVYQELQIRLSNPLTGHMVKGALSSLITRQLKQYLSLLNAEEQHRLASTVDIPANPCNNEITSTEPPQT